MIVAKALVRYAIPLLAIADLAVAVFIRGSDR
jgi:hypothetical protein